MNSSQQTESLYGLTQSEFYQMFAYGQKYLDGTGEMYLIYPTHDDLSQPILQHLASSETLKLWGMPYRIMAKCREQVMYSKSIDLSLPPARSFKLVESLSGRQ